MAGVCLGSPIGTKLIEKYRLSSIVVGLNLFSVVVNTLKLVLNYPLMLATRFLYGLSAGALQVCLSNILNDSVPNEVAQTYGVASNSGICFGIFLAGLVQALCLPMADDGDEALQQNESWRIVFGFSIIVELLVVILGLTVFKAPSLKQLSEEDYDAQLQRIYLCKSPEDLKVLKAQLQQNSSQ